MNALSIIGVTLLLSGTAAAQCEITRLVFPEQWMTFGAFNDARVTALVPASVVGTVEIRILDAGQAGWEQTGIVPVPGTFFGGPNILHHGDRLVIGDDGAMNTEGRVTVLKSGGFEATLAGSGLEVYDRFGSGLAMSDDLLVVGANMYGSGSGKSYVFERTGSGWTEVASFTPHGFNHSPIEYGDVIDTDGQTIVCGVQLDDNGTSDSGVGAAYVYERDASGWHEVAKLVASDAAAWRLFGSDVAVDGDQLLVGSERGGAGVVYVFERGPAGWSETQIVHPSAGEVDDWFGDRLDMDGDRAVVGAPGVDTDLEQQVGAIYVLERGAAGWVETLRMVASDAPAYSRFGLQVQIDGNQVAWTGRDPEIRLLSLGIERATNYCVSTPNSTGSAARISVEGCDSRIANTLTLVAKDVPVNRAGLFFYGRAATQIPFGNGALCVRAPQQRLLPTQSDAAGVLRTTIDFQAAQAQALTAGATWRFQAYFRDPNVGAGFDTSDAVAVDVQR